MPKRSYTRKKRTSRKRSSRRRRSSAYSGYQTGGAGVIQKKVVAVYEVDAGSQSVFNPATDKGHPWLIIPYRWPCILAAIQNNTTPYWYDSVQLMGPGGQFADMGQFSILGVKVQFINNTQNIIFQDGMIGDQTKPPTQVQSFIRNQNPVIFTTFVNDSLIVSQKKSEVEGQPVTRGFDVRKNSIMCGQDATKYLKVSNNFTSDGKTLTFKWTNQFDQQYKIQCKYPKMQSIGPYSYLGCSMSPKDIQDIGGFAFKISSGPQFSAGQSVLVRIEWTVRSVKYQNPFTYVNQIRDPQIERDHQEINQYLGAKRIVSQFGEGYALPLDFHERKQAMLRQREAERNRKLSNPSRMERI